MAQTFRLSLFDANWYLARNPDVAAAVEAGLFTAEQHFQGFGRLEGRSPGPLFDTDFYLATNPDVAAAVADGLFSAFDHFVHCGAAEGRSPLGLFDPVFYLAQNPDVAAAVANSTMTATEHFLLFGHHELRQISPVIELRAYLGANADVALARADGFVSPLVHLLTYGLADSRDLGNGIHLDVFANDPVFSLAIQQGDLQRALERVSDVAPFLPDFQPPAGWLPLADTPIPVDFVPPEDVRLVIPPSVVVPPDVTLPKAFVPVVPGLTPPPEREALEDDGPPPPRFTVNLSGDPGDYIISFGGTATGDIRIAMVEVDGGGGEGVRPLTHLTFWRDGYKAVTRPAIADLGDGIGIPTLAGGDKFIVDGGGPFLPSEFAAVQAKMAGDVSFALTSVSVGLEVLHAMEVATTGLVDATSVEDTTGTVEHAKHVLITKNGTGGDKINMAGDINVMSFSDTTATAADLRAIEEATTGYVNATRIHAVEGSVADVMHILVTKYIPYATYSDGIWMRGSDYSEKSHDNDPLSVTLTDVGSVQDTDRILTATTGVVTTSLLHSGTYGKFASGDKIATGLNFSSGSSGSLSNNNDLEWEWDATKHTLIFETAPDSSQNVTLTLTGIASVSETGGVFTLSTAGDSS